ncbi:DNA polymerase III subunit gamma/tau [Microvirga brassicacearum]|uniref:DNA polymerase III subunit gamma/tau n=1 Tax=Microvirga brassicacearum TaxID=2580413 RepID=A0A5N3PCX9_9HYPH|nr:DNA polymerase III subunit gamma/tau [Microvirga brassicacearum]KAB0267597.1 DNA polymerase III subunit gamma/tau [Microvirga brassicacearum]
MDETAAGTPLNDEPALPGFPLEPPAAAGSPYRVLARKYRPRTFEDLIGQEAMVRTLSNAFETGRIPQAWMLTGVRGVGKTTTARILARGLNYQKADGSGAPTIHMPDLGLHCEAIMESRHVDVLEMDAASHTGIDDVRQIIDGIRYSPVTARYKVYIIDEVHMLSEKAFNAFLKTLEEPPPHAKFIFATTEIRKVPVTILSRCQRFDLRRIEADKLVAHLGRICTSEGVQADAEALASIARAAEGSARDSLSLMDQAIAHGAGVVTGDTVREMLGLADRTQVIDLFEAIMRGDVPAAFAGLRAQYDAGADPAVILSDLATFSHVVTRLKLIPDAAKDPVLSEAERTRGLEYARTLSVRSLSRAWQILLKGIPEVQASNRPLATAEMVLVRLAYAADLPTPDEALRALKDGSPVNVGAPPSAPSPPRPAGSSVSGNMALATSQARPQPRPEPAPDATPAIRLRRFEDVVAMAGEQRDIVLKRALERDVHLVRFEEGHIEFSLVDGANRTVANDLSRALQQWTGQRWMVALSSDAGAPTLHHQAETVERERKEGAANHPLVQAVLAKFPGAQIVNVVDRSEKTGDGGPADPAPLGLDGQDLDGDDDL